MLAVAALAAPPDPSVWQEPVPKETPPKVAFTLASKTARPGGTAKGKVVVTFASGLHGYQNPPTMDYMIPVALDCLTKDVVLKPEYPKGVVKEFVGEKAAVYEGAVSIPVSLKLPKRTGKLEVKVKVNYQQCNDTGCFPPSSQTVSANLNLTRAKTLRKKKP